jgi:hypothetical protein
MLHLDPPSDILITCLIKEPNSYTKTIRLQHFKTLLERQTAFLASILKVQGLQEYVNSDSPLKTNSEAFAMPDAKEWAEAPQKEFQRE